MTWERRPRSFILDLLTKEAEMKSSLTMAHVITQVARENHIDLTIVGARMELQKDGYQPLVVEVTLERQIQVAHWFEENFDIVPWPCLTFVVVSEDQWIPIDKTESIGGLQSFGYADSEKVVVTDIRGQHDLADFADHWAEDIQAGWLHHAEVKTSGPPESILETEDVPF